jgi:vitamin B12 transport system substrate-binding protein
VTPRLAPLLLWCLCLAAANTAQAAQRIVSLAPSLTEIVTQLGAADRLVGVLDAGARPAGLEAVPSVGRYGQVDIERLLSLKPDLLLLWPASVSSAQRAQLQRLGLPVYVAEPHTLEQLGEQVREIGEQIGEAQRGQLLAERFALKLTDLRQRFHREPPLPVFYQVWDRPLYTIGGGQIISDAIALCGGSNIFADLKLPAPQVSIESVLQRKPWLVLVPDEAQRQAWQQWGVPHVLVGDPALERPSIDMLVATEALCERMHALPAITP